MVSVTAISLVHLLLLVSLASHLTWRAASMNKGGENEEESGRITHPPSTIYAKLIHRDSVIAPSSTMDYSGHDDYSADDFVQAPLSPYERTGLFLVNISVGQPSIPQLLMLDTGSSITWVRLSTCLGCKEEEILFYYPYNSTTLASEPCSSKFCQGVFTKCDEYINTCMSKLGYGDQLHNATVVLGREKFTFSTSDDGLQYLSNILFGYAAEVSWPSLEGINGILGLGPKKESLLIDHNYSKFSYCIGTLTDYIDSNLFSTLIIGDHAITQGISTFMEMDGYYLLTLEGITVGDNVLDIKWLEINNQMIIDAGSRFTWLVEDAYEPFKKEIKKVLQGKLDLLSDETMCYDGILKKDFKDFPFVILNFPGVNLVLEAGSIFEQRRYNRVCMSVKKITDDTWGGRSLIGMMAQQNYNVGFNLKENSVYFDRVDCQILEE